MNHRMFKPFAWLGIFLMLVSMACTMGTSTQSAPEPTQTGQSTTPAVSPTEPVATKASATTAPGQPGAVSSRDDVEKAVIRIVSQGSFVDPQIGSYEGIGSGSGFIIDPSGIAVTNNHVVTGAALIKVYFSGSDKAYNAKILGVSECSDLAVIKLEGGPFPYLQWHSGAVKLGTEVWSAGYPLGDPQYSVHKGVVSKAHATPTTSWAAVESVLEHDATINPGNSGGPLVDDNGQVIGINYASSTSANNQYFAIAKAEADPILSELEKGINDTFIGVNGTAVASDDGSITGIWVNSVASGSPADKTGLQGGDIILDMEGVTLGRQATMTDYCDILRTHQSTDTLSIKILRYSAGQLLDGQLNGRELAVTGAFDTSGATTAAATPTDAVGTTSENNGYFREEFDRTLSDWSYFFMKGKDHEDKFNLYTDAGNLSFEENAANIWAYATYDKYTYTDVSLDTTAENLGHNSNNVSLICRYTDTAWYEFNIGNDGLYNILRYDDSISNYVTLADGASNLIKQGKDTNEYTIVCKGDKLTLGINGYEVKSVHDATLKEGKIGLSVSSFDVFPVKVDFAYLDITQP
jgi:S1-C subfamily serine protease